MHVFKLRAKPTFDPKRHMERILGHVGERECRERLLGAGSDQPLSLSPECARIYLRF